MEDFFRWIQACVSSGKYVISRHAEIERLEEDIDVVDIENCIANGFLLENYPDDTRGPSCLIAGYVGENWLHVVCGKIERSAIIITVYIPKEPYWHSPIQRGEV